MDISTQAEIDLREADYETWTWSGGMVPVVCFENQATIGFLHVFLSADKLLADWEQAQKVVLSRYTAALRSAGAKAWNVYSVFLTHEVSPTLVRRIERIEEDFTMARKIARVGIKTNEDLIGALLPLLPVRAQPSIGKTDYEERLRSRLQDVPDEALEAFLGRVSPIDVARILEEGS
jgi:hypothetical protein